MPCLSVGHDREATCGTRSAMLANRDGEGAAVLHSTTQPHGPLPTADTREVNNLRRAIAPPIC